MHFFSVHPLLDLDTLSYLIPCTHADIYTDEIYCNTQCHQQKIQSYPSKIEYILSMQYHSTQPCTIKSDPKSSRPWRRHKQIENFTSCDRGHQCHRFILTTASSIEKKHLTNIFNLPFENKGFQKPQF